MDLLLDTCAFLYLCNQPSKLSVEAKLHIMNAQNRRFLSLASVWEMAIKINPAHVGNQKLEIGKPLNQFIPEHLARYKIDLLPVELIHTYEAGNLRPGHAAPFDRIIIAQGLVLSIPIVTSDTKWNDFGVKVIW
jgi:PIN domain nuclease of toxin-antitoxin system